MRLTVLLGVAAGCDLIDASVTEATPHPCVGHRTDAVLQHDGALWVGCGSTTEGAGLYVSRDGARSWEGVRAFDAFRVSSITAAMDGSLTIAGTDRAGPDRAARWDGSTRSPRFVSGSQTWNSFHVGAWAETPGGLEVAESLTGYDLAFREPGGEWSDGYGWWTGETSHQILDLAVAGDRVIGVGSTILEPPTVMVQTPDAGFRADPIVLAPFRGELWSVDADGDALVVGGVDQDRGEGVVFTTTGDPTDPTAWSMFALEAIDDATWIRAVCREGDRVIAAGEYTVRSEGLLFESIDGGGTWRDITPAGAPSITACDLRDGALVVAGAEGWIAL